MKVTVIGPGALGCLFAAKLSRTNQVWLLDHDPERALRLTRTGVVLEEGGQLFSCPVMATADAGAIGPSDLILLCVKSHQIEEAVLKAGPVLREGGFLLALANGITHLQLLDELCRGRCWGVGVTAQGATLTGTGRVVHRGEGGTKVGLPPGKNEITASPQSCGQILLAAAGTLTRAGIPTTVVSEVLPHLWGKLLVNVGINALTAINNCPNGALLASSQLSEKMTAAVLEGALVAGRLGIELPADPVSVVKEVCRATAANYSSMLQDVRAGRRTEIGAINGEVLRLARSLGVEAPVNEELVGKVKMLERNNRVLS